MYGISSTLRWNEYGLYLVLRFESLIISNSNYFLLPFITDILKTSPPTRFNQIQPTAQSPDFAPFSRTDLRMPSLLIFLVLIKLGPLITASHELDYRSGWGYLRNRITFCWGDLVPAAEIIAPCMFIRYQPSFNV